MSAAKYLGLRDHPLDLRADSLGRLPDRGQLGRGLRHGQQLGSEQRLAVLQRLSRRPQPLLSRQLRRVCRVCPPDAQRPRGGHPRGGVDSRLEDEAQAFGRVPRLCSSRSSSSLSR